MGQKVNPIGLRLGINRTWESRWYANTNDYGDMLHADLTMRNYIFKELAAASISRVIIERPHKTCRITIHTARPGIVIGKKGADIESLRAKLQKYVDGELFINLVEVRKPEIDAKIVADSIAQQLERRVSYRRAMKRSLQTAMRMGAIGCKIKCGGRLGGIEIARDEQYQEGSVPLHTLRADIDYGTASAMTTMGIIGIKVWINKGEIMEHDPYAHDKRIAEQSGGGRPQGQRTGGRPQGGRGRGR
ncbi:MAG: 30S ribosomal protein S3 [Robiginitomaculum sp.]|nr:30S ribosomal protein S3 [Robiginitomaculum sp.]